jgi:hypothetical protein
VKVFRDRWQFELKIIRHIIPDPGASEEALEGQFLVLSKWYRLCSCRRIPTSSRGIVLAIIDEGRRPPVIILRLRLVNFRSGGRRRPEGGIVVGGEGESQQALSVTFAAWQVVGPRH